MSGAEFPRFRVALTVVVDQAGCDEGDAYNRAVTNLGLHRPLFREGRNHTDPEVFRATVVRFEGVMVKELRDDQ